VNPRRILAILVKDLRDAWRDGRIVLLLLLPIGMVIPLLSGDPNQLPSTTVAIADGGDGRLARELRSAADRGVRIEVTQAGDAASARRLVGREDAELAVLVPPAAPPPGEILVAESASPAAQSVAALVPDALARADGHRVAARPQVRSVAPAQRSPIDIVGREAVSALFAIIILATLVAMMVVPIQTAEELETGTFGALRLAATAPEILAAKALAGLLYGSAGVALIVAVTGMEMHDPLLFAAAALGLLVSLVGFGLLLGLLAPSSNAINTYGAFLVAPVAGAAVAVFVLDPGVVRTILDGLPFTQAAKLLGNGVAPGAFHTGAVAWLVIGAWALAGYGALVRVASRREL
jgi:ABC-type Na+ efflux pump permease subunit